MLGLQITAPGYLVLKLIVVFFQDLYRFGVGHAAKVGLDNVRQSVGQTLVDEGIAEGDLLGGVLHDIAENVFEHGFRRIHILLQIAEGHFRLDHPELRRMARGVRILCTEGGPKGVDVAERLGIGLVIQLAGNRQVDALSEEILRVIHCAILRQGHVGQIQGGHLEHLAGALRVGGGDERRVHIHKAALLEEAVDGVGRQRADAEHGLVFCSG